MGGEPRRLLGLFGQISGAFVGLFSGTGGGLFAGGGDGDWFKCVKDFFKKLFGKGDPPPGITVTGVTIYPSSTTIKVGDKAQLTATVQPTGASQSVTWSSSDTSVASVSNGTVTAKGAGTATITVKTVEGKKTATCTVTVSFNLHKELKNMKDGNTVVNYQTQGLAVGGTYCYSFEVNYPFDTDHNLYRIHKTSKNIEKMTRSGTINLYHANDVALAAFKVNNVDKLFMYVVTFNTYEIIKLEYDGSGNYSRVATYTYAPVKDKNGIPVPDTNGDGHINGISLIGNKSNSVEFLLQARETFYTVEIPFTHPNNSSISPRYAFTITRPDSGRQNFHYDKSKDKIYVIWPGANANMVNAYSGIAAAIAKNDKDRKASPTKSPVVAPWPINSTNFFEVEGGGFYGSTYWFSTFEGFTTTSGGKNGGLYTDSRIN